MIQKIRSLYTSRRNKKKVGDQHIKIIVICEGMVASNKNYYNYTYLITKTSRVGFVPGINYR